MKNKTCDILVVFGYGETGTKELNGISKLVQDQFKAIEMDATSMATPFKNN